MTPSEAKPEYLTPRGKRNSGAQGRHRPGAFVATFLITAYLSLAGHVSGLDAQQTLTILHTSEHHGTALPIERPGQQRIAGLAFRATVIESIRNRTEATLLVDSGDILIGSALSSFFRGEPDLKAMSLMRYDAMGAGNHDFDFGLKHLEQLTTLATFPILCSNLRASGGKKLPCRASAMIQVGNLTLGLISLLGHSNFPDSFNREVVQHLALTDPVATARRFAQTLKQEGADLVIAMTHQETAEDESLLARAPEVDVIIGGHTEGFDGLRSAKTPSPVEELVDPGPVFVKTHRQGRTIGRLDLLIGGKSEAPERVRVLKATARNVPVDENVPPHPDVHALVNSYRSKLDAESGTVVGRSLVRLDGENRHIRSRETNLGTLLADILRKRFDTEVALLNAGQIRDSIPAGPVTRKQVISVLPFDSPTVTFSLTGTQLRLALENSVSRLPNFNGRFLQVSGLSVVFDVSSPPGQRVLDVSVNEERLRPERSYTVATDAFLADGGDGYTMFALGQNRVDRGLPMRDLLLEALHAGPLTAGVRGRIRFAGQSHTLPGGEAQRSVPPLSVHSGVLKAHALPPELEGLDTGGYGR